MKRGKLLKEFGKRLNKMARDERSIKRSYPALAEYIEKMTKYGQIHHVDRIYNMLYELYQWGFQLNIDADLTKAMLITRMKEHARTGNLYTPRDRVKYNQMPKATHRDNKQTYNGSGNNSRYPTHRYPKKNRNRKTWANFYALFPYLAQKDGWDRKTSKRMK